MESLHALALLPVFVFASLVSQMGGTVSPSTILTGPDKAFLGSKVVFQCQAPLGWPAPITYQLLRDINNLVTTLNDAQGGQPVKFSLKLSMTSEGSYHCVAMAGDKTDASSAVHLLVVTPVSGVTVTSDPNPPILYEGARLLLRCDVTRGSHPSYTWYFNRQEVTSSWLAEGAVRLAGNTLLVENAAARHAGNYGCMAGTKISENNKRFSSSGELHVTFKFLVSAPKISYTISKEGMGYQGNITCQSFRGSPPVTFHLSLEDREMGPVVATETPLVAWFLVPIVPARDMGVAHCQVENHMQQLTSEPLTLEVVPVGRASVKVDVEHLYMADSKMAATRLSCVSQGTFPSFSWSLNGSLLTPDSQSHGFVDHGRLLLLSEVTTEVSGYYRCRVRDSYDGESHWVESKPVLVHVTEVTMATIEIIAIVFCCFLLLTLAGSVVFVMRMLVHSHDDLNETAISHVLSLSELTSCPETIMQIQELEMTA